MPLGRGRAGFHLGDGDYRTGSPVVPADMSSFVGLFLSRAALQRAGLPDPRLFIYGDDQLYTLQMRRAGLRIGFAPQVWFDHDTRPAGAGWCRAAPDVEGVLHVSQCADGLSGGGGTVVLAAGPGAAAQVAAQGRRLRPGRRPVPDHPGSGGARRLAGRLDRSHDDILRLSRSDTP